MTGDVAPWLVALGLTGGLCFLARMAYDVVALLRARSRRRPAKPPEVSLKQGSELPPVGSTVTLREADWYLGDVVGLASGSRGRVVHTDRELDGPHAGVHVLWEGYENSIRCRPHELIWEGHP
ncbi:hypothetical protein [Clavibacter sp. VKM Ac-2872]|uniref:hypothetical protein n=1 Tax=Clavibacter sp. VKM Ac-2872 TaxID=2783812 RepID=UPI001889FB95|nr:hypothetical protein [Clavibacter sp. VKM Ac-2872]MBF4625527.1 hypothetical protein [Clavibacter sp. VKM Ac-2872]